MKHNCAVTIVALLVVLTGLASATKMGAWTMSREHVSEHETMRITIHLKQSNLNELDVRSSAICLQLQNISSA